MAPVLGVRVTGVLDDVVRRRRVLLDDALAAQAGLSPGQAEALQTRLLRGIGLRLELDTYIELCGEGLVSPELLKAIRRDNDTRRDALGRPARFDLRAGLRLRLRHLPLFAALPDARRDDIAQLLTIRLVLPGDRILPQRQRTGDVYVVSSGEVELQHDGRRLRLGCGGLFGGDGMLSEAQTQGAVTAVRFCHLLALSNRSMRRLLAERPELVVAEAADPHRDRPISEAGEPAAWALGPPFGVTP
jgi:CPA1 family monovalent cation:H+ antiporter